MGSEVSVIISSTALKRMDSEIQKRLEVSLKRKGIVVDENLQTNVKGIYAIGDAVGKAMFAGVGITEDAAKLQGMNYKTSKFLFASNGKALSLGEPEGFVKVIADENDYVIGVHIMGPHVSDLIHEGTIAISNHLKIDDIAKTIHAHPTLAESFAEAVLGIKKEAIHMAPVNR